MVSITKHVSTLTRTLEGRCGDCKHVWPVAYLPMPIDKACQIMASARCPKCACARIFVSCCRAEELPSHTREEPQIDGALRPGA
jgi:hypothetical protein